MGVPQEKFLKLAENDMENDSQLELWSGTNDEYHLVPLFHFCLKFRLYCSRNDGMLDTIGSLRIEVDLFKADSEGKENRTRKLEDESEAKVKRLIVFEQLVQALQDHLTEMMQSCNLRHSGQYHRVYLILLSFLGCCTASSLDRGTWP